MKKYYEILEVNPNASIEIIEKAYKVLAKKYHPDLYVGNERTFAEKKMRDINEAYKILSDEFLREQYDSELIRETENKIDNKFNKSIKQKVNEKKKSKQENNSEIEINKNDLGTYRGILGVTKAIFQNRPKINIKDLKKEDYIAAGLTIITMVILLIILWFIPVTKSFVKNMMPFLN